MRPQIDKLFKLMPETRLAQIQSQVPIMRVNYTSPIYGDEYAATNGQKYKV